MTTYEKWVLFMMGTKECGRNETEDRLLERHRLCTAEGVMHDQNKVIRFTEILTGVPTAEQLAEIYA